MNKALKVLSFLTAFLVMFTVFPSIALASEFEGTPAMRLASSQTIDATVGEETEVRIRVQNVGSGSAFNFFMQVQTPAGSPFTAVARNVAIGNDTLGARGIREIPVTIDVNPTAEPGTYPLTLNFVYTDHSGSVIENSQTMHVRIAGQAVTPRVSLTDFEMNPGSLRPGGTAVVSATYQNASTSRARDVRVSLSGLSNEGVTVVGGLSSVSINETGTGHFSETISFTITAASNVRSGSYPITFTTTYTDEWGADHQNENIFFVSVGAGGLLPGDSALTVTNIRTADGVFEVGQNFTVGFDLVNNGTGPASSIRVTARAAVEDSAVVPTSQNIQIIRTLAAGESNPVSFTFAATSSASTRNYPIGITIEYFDGEVNDPDAERISFSHYFGVNISNTEDDDNQRNRPRIIISDYSSSPMIVTAGDTFDLNMTFFNTHASETVSNIRITLTAQERDQERGANIFSPVGASNTLFVANIPPGGSVTRNITFFTVPDAQPQNYTISVNFDYEDSEGGQLSSEELIGINVSQPPRIEISQISIPPMGMIGQPVFVDFELYNVGRVNINNLRVVMEGDFRVDGSASTWFGNFEQGDFERFSTIFFPNSPGLLTGTIFVEYESATGQQYSIPHEFSMEIEDMPMMDFPDGDRGWDDMPMEEEGGMSIWVFIIGGGAVLCAGAYYAWHVIRKRKKEFEFDE